MGTGKNDNRQFNLSFNNNSASKGKSELIEMLRSAWNEGSLDFIGA